VTYHENNVERRIPKDTSKLKQFMVEEWGKIPQETAQTLICSMKNCCYKKMEIKFHYI